MQQTGEWFEQISDWYHTLLLYGYMPSCVSKAKVQPLPEGNNKDFPLSANYCGIVLASCFSKITESEGQEKNGMACEWSYIVRDASNIGFTVSGNCKLLTCGSSTDISSCDMVITLRILWEKETWMMIIAHACTWPSHKLLISFYDSSNWNGKCIAFSLSTCGSCQQNFITSARYGSHSSGMFGCCSGSILSSMT